MARNANSDGLINWLRRARPAEAGLGCLLQPGQLLDQPLKSMRVNPFQLIKFCYPRTVPAAETESIGLQADARVVMVFASLSGQFYCDMTNSAHLSGPRHLDSFMVTRNIRSSIWTGKNFATATQTATH